MVKECILGQIVDGVMRKDEAGQVVENMWVSLPERYPDVVLDSFVVMPNHLHAIIMISVGAIHESPDTQQQKRRTMTLSKVMGYLKMNAAKQINQLRNNPGCPVWQRDYYERVIRDDKELNAIREYIENNPMQWNLDRNNPSNIHTPSL